MPSKQKIVISASRRTDIPAFYMDWFMKRINAGQFETVNPYNKKTYYVPASPEQVSTIVFWSKNFDIFIKKNYWKTLKELGYNLFFNFTINSHDPILEPNLPDLGSRLEQAGFLSEKFGGNSINWRFDPLISYKRNNTIHSPLSQFKMIADSLAEHRIIRCVTSFIDMYGKVKKRLSQIETIDFVPISKQKQIEILLEMATSLEKNNMMLNLCCEKKLFEHLPKHAAITESSCIDNRLIKELFTDNISLAKDTGQRKEMGCNCKKSYDIGSYHLQPCYHNCIYCYANPKQIANRSSNIESTTS